ncbi:uncharacterized protein LOC120654249 [Panicum virgatum]|uniref:VQ domain-containing protein n=1 Tax=Panicum virgatum TaxID=38727 RepID=A0A8T0X3W3_PANVG|nr:uncharacterized protein LOC120654249 [Panicum virgatum]KAG2654125.1 hypothetical protein PVAP13_1NG496400 [Panicum virgatum]
MYPCEQDRTAAARTALTNAGYERCAVPRSLQLSSRHQPGKQAVPPPAAAVPPRRARCKKHGASSSRRSSTTVVATDVNNFRAMVQELTGFPAPAILRPLPRRVHAASPFAAAGGAGHGCSGSERHGHRGAGSSSPDAPAPLPAMAPPPLGLFDGLIADLGSPEFDTSWGDLSME